MNLTSRGSKIHPGPGTLPQRRARRGYSPAKMPSVWIRKRHRTRARPAPEASPPIATTRWHPTGCDPYHHPVVLPGRGPQPCSSLHGSTKLPGWTPSNQLDCTVVSRPVPTLEVFLLLCDEHAAAHRVISGKLPGTTPENKPRAPTDASHHASGLINALIRHLPLPAAPNEIALHK